MIELLKENITNSANIRLHLNTVLHKKANDIRKQFKSIFQIDPKYFTKFKDLKYYRGGYPSENTKPRIDTLVDSVSEMLYLFEFVNDSELKDKFKEMGVTFSLENVDEKYKSIYPKEVMVSQFKSMLDEALLLQGEICREADKIKINNLNEFNEISNKKLLKSNYEMCVHHKVLDIKGRNKEKFMDKIEETVQSISKTVDMINEK